MTMTMNRCKPILSSQAVSLLWSSSSTSSQANTSITSSRRLNTNHGGDKKNNNLLLAVGTATAASALAYKLYQERDRSAMVGFSLSGVFIADILGFYFTPRKPDLRSRLNNFPSITEFVSSPVQIRSSTISPPSRLSTSLVKLIKLSSVEEFISSFISSGQKTVMMSPMDFYSSITPDCSIHPGAGSGIYEEISDERLPKTRLDKSPYESSVLNIIGQNGLISYNDYCFLLALLATPVRFIETAFNVFDVTGDGNIDAKV